MNHPRIVQRAFEATSAETVRMANDAAAQGSMEPSVRRVAAHVVRRAKNVPAAGPRLCAEWVRRNILYTQESHGYELLQGPIATLSIRTGDCDDLAILWASMVRSIGLPAFVVGLRDADGDTYFHAVGFDRQNGVLYELSADHTYGAPRRGLRMAGVPRGVIGDYWDPVSEAWMRPEWGRRRVHASLSGVDSAERVAERIAPVVGGVGQAFGQRGEQITDTLLASASSGLGAAKIAVMLGASGPVGAVVGALVGAGLVAAHVAGAVRQSRELARDAVDLNAWRDTWVSLLGLSNDEAKWMRLRIDELLPKLNGTYGSGPGAGIRIASVADVTPPRGTQWADGSVTRRSGVQSVMWSRANWRARSRQLAGGYVAIMRGWGEFLATVPLSQRQEVMFIALEAYLGEGAARHALPPSVAARLSQREIAAAETAAVNQRRDEQRRRVIMAAPALVAGAYLITKA